MNERPDLNASLRLSIQKRIGDFNIDMSEILLDSLLSDETLKEIPIIKSIHALGKIGITIRDQFMVKKLYRLLFEIDSVSDSDRAKFIQKLDSDYSKKNIYENLLVLIDRIDNDEKMSIMGKILKAMLEHKLDTEIGFRLFTIIDKAYIEDLILLNLRYGKRDKGNSDPEWLNKWNKIVEEGLSNLGLLKPVIGDNAWEQKYMHRSNAEYKIKDYKISILGKHLVDNGF